MPRTLAALADGTISEWRATLICRETVGLSREHRAMVDAELEGRLGGAGDRRVVQLARAAAYRLDPQAVVDRSARAVSDRRVTIRPAPDTMASVSALLPVEAGVAVYAALRRAADSSIAAGDERGRGQVMADLLVDRVLHPQAAIGGTGTDSDTGTAGAVSPAVDSVDAVRAAYAAAAGCGAATPRSPGADIPGVLSRRHGRASPPPAVGVPPGVNVEIGLVVTDQALFGGDDEPALLDGEVMPAALARALVANLPAGSKAWIRRLYTRPESGQLAAMDSRRRLFDENLRRFILTRDQRCRTPWCDAPIRHADHVQPAARGGPTAASNGDGLSADCNYVREAPGWGAVTGGPDGDTVIITTPTGHTYTSRPPALPGPRSGRQHTATASRPPRPVSAGRRRSALSG